jgi:hypothetical protein
VVQNWQNEAMKVLNESCSSMSLKRALPKCEMLDTDDEQQLCAKKVRYDDVDNMTQACCACCIFLNTFVDRIPV